MASNFRIDRHRNGESLHLKLKGDFDGTSAYELADTIRKLTDRSNRIFVHTDNLRNVLPFGCGVFQSRFPSSGGRPDEVIFTGRYAGQVAPAGSRVK